MITQILTAMFLVIAPMKISTPTTPSLTFEKDKVNPVVAEGLKKDLDIQVQESEGIPVAFKKYFETFTPKYGTDKTKLWDLVKTRLPWITE